MYNHQLDTFIATAELGSFSAAAEKLYISASAVSQQISNLEKFFECPLFIRTNHGVRLTDIGDYLYHESIKLRDRCSGIVSAVHEMKKQRNSSLVLGISDLFLPHFFYEYWVQFAKNHRTCIVNTIVLSSSFYEEGTQRPDVVEHINDGEPWQKDYSFLKLGTTPLAIAVPPAHPLAKLDKLTFADLRPYELVNTPDGIHSKTIDDLNQKLSSEGIHTVKPETYGQVLFNECILKNRIVQIPGIWAQRVTGMIVKEVDWGYKLDTGLFYLEGEHGLTDKFINFVRSKQDTCSVISDR